MLKYMSMKWFVRNTIVIAVLFCCTFTLRASLPAPDSLWYKANDAYAMGEYGNAADIYENIEKSGYVSSDLYYNLGNAYYKLGQKGKAILYYEKAFKLDPSNQDIKTNLEIARLNALDKIDVLPEFIFTTWIKEIRNSMSSNQWGYMAVSFLTITALMLIGYRFAPTSRRRKLSFVLACFTLLLMVFSVSFALNLKGKALSEDFAVVMAPVSNVKSAPNATGNNLFILHEGAKVEVLENVAGWSRIEISDGRQGWMQTSDMSLI